MTDGIKAFAKSLDGFAKESKGKPLLDVNRKRIGTIDHAWVEGDSVVAEFKMKDKTRMSGVVIVSESAKVGYDTIVSFADTLTEESHDEKTT